ncbi:MAG TPA: hypothetical protein VJ742_12640 [Nitrososphaera sp.]|nr:hypothetical protein [Nitrososphaera sp.]
MSIAEIVLVSSIFIMGLLFAGVVYWDWKEERIWNKEAAQRRVEWQQLNREEQIVRQNQAREAYWADESKQAGTGWTRFEDLRDNEQT